MRLEPRELRRRVRARLAAGRGRRIRVRRPRSPQSRHRLRRTQRDAVRSAHRPGVGRGSARRTRRRHRPARQLPPGADDAGDLLRSRQADAVLRQQPPVEDQRRRRALEQDQPRPHAADVDDPDERRQVRDAAVGAAGAARSHLHGRAVVPGPQAHLGRHRRRADPRDRRRGRDVEGRHAAGDRAVGEGVGDGCRTLRAADRLRRGEHASPRRSARTSTGPTTAARRGRKS